MKKYSILVFVICCTLCYTLFGQRSLTKQEITSSWKIKEMHDVDFLKNLDFLPINDSIKKKLSNFYSSYDTIGFFSITEYGMISLDRCRAGSMPSNIYVYWKESGRVFLQKMYNHCVEEKKELISASVFNFFEQNIKNIEEEFIMPVITGAREENGKTYFNRVITSHEPSYLLFCKVGKLSKTLVFSESYLTNKNGMFYSDNLSSKSYQWFLQTKRDIVDR